MKYKYLIYLSLMLWFSITKAQTTIDFPITTGNDDAEFRTSNNTVNLTSSDLELHGKDGSTPQVSYLRFQNVNIPQNAVIQSVHLIFTLKSNSTTSNSLNIYNEIGNVAAHTTSSTSFQNRNYGSPINWVTSPSSSNSLITSPNLLSIVNLMEGTNTVGFKIQGDELGLLNVYSRNGSSTKQPKLRITYIIDNTPKPVTAIQLSCNTSNYIINNNYQFVANVLPINATNKTINWSTTNPTIATVNSSGLVTTINSGVVDIIATSVDGSFTESCRITVTANPNPVVYKWSGALTPNSIKINAKLTNETNDARALVSTNTSFTNPIYSVSIPVMDTTNKMASFTVNDLSPNTEYYYAIESNGVIDLKPESIGKFKTPESGASSYTFTVGSCNNDSSKPVWKKIKEKNPLFMMVPGDLHYGNPTSLKSSRTAYENLVLKIENTKALFNEVPIATVWDDHDYAGNDANSNSSNKEGAKQAYREYVPHYPFGDSSLSPAIYQSFVIGRIKYIMMDLRSEKTSTRICSEDQIEWFKNEVLDAKANNQMIAWVSSYGVTSSSSDSWGGNINYRTQRNAIFNFLKSENIQNLFIISGDAHMAGIDDGENADCVGVVNSNNCPRVSSSINPKYPILQSSPIYPLNISQKGIITNILPMTGQSSNGQYTKVDVIDNNTDIIKICFTVYRVNNSGVETVLGTYCFERNLNVETTITNEQLISYNDSWKYFANDHIPATNWNSISYNDTNWNSGNAPLGFGISSINTTIPYGPSSSRKYITSYFRKDVNISNIDEISNLSINAKIDDGAVFYLNGIEIGRTKNIPQNQTYNTLATSAGNNGSTAISIPVDMNIFKNALQEGKNVLSAEVHQNTASSGDLYFAAEININRNIIVSQNSTFAINSSTDSKEKHNNIEIIETNFDNQFEIYPNPSDGRLVIKNNKIDDSDYKISIYTLSGSFIKSLELNKRNSTNEFYLNDLAPQVYLVLIYTKDNVVLSKKWIKNK